MNKLICLFWIIIGVLIVCVVLFITNNSNEHYFQEMEILKKSYDPDRLELIYQSTDIIVEGKPAKTNSAVKTFSTRALLKSKKAKTDEDKLIWYLVYKKYLLNGKPYESGGSPKSRR